MSNSRTIKRERERQPHYIAKRLERERKPSYRERKKRYRAKRRAEGLCLSCNTYTPENPRTGKPYQHCRWCRIKAAQHYAEYRVQEYPWQLRLDQSWEAA